MNGDLAGDRPFVAEVDVGFIALGLRLCVPAVEASLPVARQALRAMGDTLAADREALEDAELALTEACANAVEHAYPDDEGVVEITLSPGEQDMHVSVRDFGRGMPSSDAEPLGGRGYGLLTIEGIARTVEVRGDGGTEVAMTLGMGAPEVSTVDGAIPGVQPAERVLRRLVAVVAAQADMPVDRTLEALLVAEMAARAALRRLVGDTVKLRITRSGEGIELRVGPLEENGAEAAVSESEVPAIGSVVKRLASAVHTEREQAHGVNVEYLVLRIEPGVAAPL